MKDSRNEEFLFVTKNGYGPNMEATFAGILGSLEPHEIDALIKLIDDRRATYPTIDDKIKEAEEHLAKLRMERGGVIHPVNPDRVILAATSNSGPACECKGSL
jgi:hypothetical protein